MTRKERKAKGKRVHVNKYEGHSKIEETKRLLEEAERRRSQQTPKRTKSIVVGNSKGHGAYKIRIYRMMPEDNYTGAPEDPFSEERGLAGLL